MENNERKQNLMVNVEIAKTHNKELNDIAFIQFNLFNIKIVNRINKLISLYIFHFIPLRVESIWLAFALVALRYQ